MRARRIEGCGFRRYRTPLPGARLPSASVLEVLSRRARFRLGRMWSTRRHRSLSLWTRGWSHGNPQPADAARGRRAV